LPWPRRFADRLLAAGFGEEAVHTIAVVNSRALGLE